MLIVGTGLSMVDVALSSPSTPTGAGSAPSPAAAWCRVATAATWPTSPLRHPMETGTIEPIVAANFGQICRASQQGDDWRDVVARCGGSRPSLQAPEDGREAALPERLPALSNVHLFRMPQEVADRFEALQEAGRTGPTTTESGSTRTARRSRLLRNQRQDRRRRGRPGGQLEQRRIRHRRQASPVLAGLRRRTGRPDELGLGLDVDERVRCSIARPALDASSRSAACARGSSRRRWDHQDPRPLRAVARRSSHRGNQGDPAATGAGRRRGADQWRQGDGRANLPKVAPTEGRPISPFDLVRDVPVVPDSVTLARDGPPPAHGPLVRGLNGRGGRPAARRRVRRRRRGQLMVTEARAWSASPWSRSARETPSSRSESAATDLADESMMVSIEAEEAVTTGISAGDRARTIAVAVDPPAGPEDLVQLGHIFPLRAAGRPCWSGRRHKAAGRPHRGAGLRGAGVLCQVVREGGRHGDRRGSSRSSPTAAHRDASTSPASSSAAALPSPTPRQSCRFRRDRD